MGFRLSGNTWTKDEEGDSNNKDPSLKKGKKKGTASKRKMSWKIVSPLENNYESPKGKH